MNIQEFYTSIRKPNDPESLDFQSLNSTNYFDDSVSSHTAHYLKVFQRNTQRSGLFINWNWVAFLFAPIWMLYRRLYSAYILLIGVSILIPYLPYAVMFALLMNIGVAALGDSVYIYFVRQAHGRRQVINPENLPLAIIVCIHFVISSIIYYANSYSESNGADEGFYNIKNDA